MPLPPSQARQVFSRYSLLVASCSTVEEYSRSTHKMWNLVFLSVAFVAVSAQHMVPVDVYYESLCPDSIAFVTEQLAPTYSTSLKNNMDLNLIPYGKASQKRSADNHSWEFECHHGPVECYGNKVHGCILKKVQNKDDQMKYISCLMKQAKTKKNVYPLEGCIAGEDLTVTRNCANDTHSPQNGADILAAYGDETARLNPPLTTVPTVVFNKVYNKTEQTMAQSDFKKILCSYLKGNGLSECGQHPNSAAAISLSALAAIFPFLAFRLL